MKHGAIMMKSTLNLRRRKKVLVQVAKEKNAVFMIVSIMIMMVRHRTFLMEVMMRNNAMAQHQRKCQKN